MMDFCKGIFPVVSYAYTCIPTYPGGQIGFLLCSKNEVLIIDMSFVLQQKIAVFKLIQF